ncbi:hypothetical protein MRX96_007046 [Rhipicephalus microplus]
MYDTEDDDTHLCLKCSATITGLKNYIAHRKQHCYKIVRSDSAFTSVASPTTEHPYEPSSLRADDFFSSLELQSIQAVIPSTATAKVDHADDDLEDADDSDGDLYPPTSHTGGKWKPGWGAHRSFRLEGGVPTRGGPTTSHKGTCRHFGRIHMHPMQQALPQ